MTAKHMIAALFCIIVAVVVIACAPSGYFPEGGARPPAETTSSAIGKCEDTTESGLYNSLMECKFSDGVVCVASVKDATGMIVCDFSALHR